MYEHIFAGLPLDKAVPLRCVKPFHNTLLFAQLRYSSAVDLRRAGSDAAAKFLPQAGRPGESQTRAYAGTNWRESPVIAGDFGLTTKAMKRTWIQFGSGLTETANGGVFLGINFKDGEEFRDLQKIVNFFR